MTSTLIDSAGATVLAAGNPFDGVSPNFDVFGAQFTAWWQKALAAVWAIAIIICAFKLITTAVARTSHQRQGYAQGVMEDQKELVGWGVNTAVVLGAAVIFTALLAVFGQ